MDPGAREKAVWIVLLAIFLGVAAAATCNGPPPHPRDPATDTEKPGPDVARQDGLVSLEVGPARVRVEVADTIEKRQRGLMFRDHLDEDRGMIFVFPEERQLSFWMRNTRIPLSIAYIGSSGRIREILDMAPLDETTHPSAEEVMYALEVNRGWFARAGVKTGDVVKGLALLPRARE